MSLVSKLEKKNKELTEAHKVIIYPRKLVCSLFSIWLMSLIVLPRSVLAQKVDVMSPRLGSINLPELKNMLAKNGLVLPLHFADQRSNTLLYTLVIPFTPQRVKENEGYSVVGVSIKFLVQARGGRFIPDRDVRILYTIPFQIDRSVEATTSAKLSAKLSAAASRLSSAIGASFTTGERYIKLYRTVTVELSSESEVTWSFEGLKDEKIPSGTYFVVAIVEVPSSRPGLAVSLSGICSAYEKSFFGLTRDSKFCKSGSWKGQVSLKKPVPKETPPAPPSPTELPIGYNFAENAHNAQWFNSNEQLRFPGRANDEQGFVLYQNYCRLMDGRIYPRVLETHPQWIRYGRIIGTFSNIMFPGDAKSITSKVGFIDGAHGSDGVWFFIDFKDKTTRKTIHLGKMLVTYSNQLVDFQVDISNIVGKAGDLTIGVDAGDSSGQDWAVWADCILSVAKSEKKLINMLPNLIRINPRNK